RSKKDLLSQFTETKRISLNNGKFFEPGDTLRQPELGKVLKLIEAKGSDGFYTGPTAQLIAKDMKRNKGTITLQDLEQYKPVIRKPLKGTYRGYEVVTMPPPSSGGIALIEMLNILENAKLDDHNSSNPLHLIIESMKIAFA